MSLERTLLVDNVLDRLQALERQVRELQRLAARPGTGPGQLAYYQPDGSLYLGPDRETVVAVYTTTAGQSIPHNTSTIVDFDTQVVDTHEAVTTSAAWRFVAPLAGDYLVASAVAMIGATAWAEHEFLRLRVFVNGAGNNIVDNRSGLDSSASAAILQANGTAIIRLGAGDALDVRVTQASGGALAMHTSPGYNHVSIARIF